MISGQVVIQEAIVKICVAIVDNYLMDHNRTYDTNEQAALRLTLGIKHTEKYGEN